MRHPIENHRGTEHPSSLRMMRAGPMTSLTGRLRRVNGSVKTASQSRSRRRIGFLCQSTSNLLQDNEESSSRAQVGPTAWQRCYDFCVDVVAVAGRVHRRPVFLCDPRRRSSGPRSHQHDWRAARRARDPVVWSARKSTLPAPQPTDTDLASAPIQAQQTTERPQAAAAASGTAAIREGGPRRSFGARAYRGPSRHRVARCAVAGGSRK